MVIYRELENIEDHRRVYSSGALSQLPRGIGCNHETEKRAKRTQSIGKTSKGAKISL